MCSVLRGVWSVEWSVGVWSVDMEIWRGMIIELEYGSTTYTEVY